jgi:hypothetical protein
MRCNAAPLIKLEGNSDDEWYRPSPSPPRFGDPGQGLSCWGDRGQSSSQQAPPKDNDDDSDDGEDDVGDYTAFYRHCGM